MPRNRPNPEPAPSPARKPWLDRLRLRVFALVMIIGIVAWSLVSFLALPALPVVGFAVAGVTLVVNLLASKLQPRAVLCWNCGRDLADQAAGVHGVPCPGCGCISEPTSTSPERALADASADASHEHAEHSDPSPPRAGA